MSFDKRYMYIAYDGIKFIFYFYVGTYHTISYADSGYEDAEEVY